jgi:hypothetical protein
MRDAVARLGGDIKRVNPQVRVDLVIDHSVQVDAYGSKEAFARNVAIEVERNTERYRFLRWAQQAFEGFHVVPPGAGIVHQVNLENLARVVWSNQDEVYPDTLVGTDSHTTMIGGVGVLGWGVGGIEAEAAMLGEPVTMLVPDVTGVRLSGQLREGATATDLVLALTHLLRKHGVVGRFVEFFGPGVLALTVPDRATVSNMSPEYGATEGIFPVDEQTLAYLRGTGRDEALVDLVERYFKQQGLFYTSSTPDPAYDDLLEFDLASVEPAVAGPARPQDLVPLGDVQSVFREALPRYKSDGGGDRRARDRRGAHERGDRRLGRDRRDHVVYQYVEPGRDGRCGVARPQRARARPAAAGPRQDIARARLAGRDRLPPASRRARRPRGARLLPRRLRLHDLHRQLGPARRTGRDRDRRARPRRRRGAERQPELRGAHPSAGEAVVPGLAAARRRLWARGHARHRPDERAAGHGLRRRARVPARYLAERR